MRGRRQGLGIIAETHQPQPDVGVLGYVPSIPAAKFPQYVGTKMIGRAAERKGQPQRAETDIDRIEQGRVFDRKKLRQRYVGANAGGSLSEAGCAVRAGISSYRLSFNQRRSV
jgi:hypothetical protein